MSDFGRNAIVAPGYAMPSEERITRTLDGTLPAHIPALTVGKIDNVSRTRIRRAFAELAQGNIENVEAWLHALAAGSPDQIIDGHKIPGARPNPALAIQLFIELAKFTVPQQKAVSVDITDKGGTKRYSMAELQTIVSEQ
jgi:hypothetical protein